MIFINELLATCRTKRKQQQHRQLLAARDAGPAGWVTAFTNDKLFEIYDHENELEDEQKHVLTIAAFVCQETRERL